MHNLQISELVSVHLFHVLIHAWYAFQRACLAPPHGSCPFSSFGFLGSSSSFGFHPGENISVLAKGEISWLLATSGSSLLIPVG